MPPFRPSNETLEAARANAYLIRMQRKGLRHARSVPNLDAYFSDDGDLAPGLVVERLMQDDGEIFGERSLLCRALGAWMIAPRQPEWITDVLLQSAYKRLRKYLRDSGVENEEGSLAQVLRLIDPNLGFLRNAIAYLGGDWQLSQAASQKELMDLRTTYVRHAKWVALLLGILHFQAENLAKQNNIFGTISKEKAYEAARKIIGKFRPELAIREGKAPSASTLETAWTRLGASADWCYVASIPNKNGKTYLQLIGEDKWFADDFARRWLMGIARRVRYVQDTIYPQLDPQLFAAIKPKVLKPSVKRLMFPPTMFTADEIALIKEHVIDRRRSGGKRQPPQDTNPPYRP